jgi:FkbM family methyltransferase
MTTNQQDHDESSLATHRLCASPALMPLGLWWRRVQAGYHAYRSSRLWLKPPCQTPHGFWLAGNTDMQQGRFEPEETAVFLSLLRDVEVCINIGANIGYYCCLALQAGKQVVAFEPMPNNLRLLMANIEHNGWSDAVEIFPMAVGSRPGIVKLFGQGTGASLIAGWAGQSSADATRVPASSLDLVLADRFRDRRCLILIDVEGAELEVLLGASQLLELNPRPIWMIEISVSEHQPPGVSINPHLLSTFELLSAAGYQAETANSTARTISLDEVRQVASTGKDSLGTHNFVFR